MSTMYKTFQPKRSLGFSVCHHFFLPLKVDITKAQAPKGLYPLLYTLLLFGKSLGYRSENREQDTASDSLGNTSVLTLWG